MKYVHVFSGQEIEADEGAVHWPWVTPDRAEVRDRIARARTSAREAVAARIAGSAAPATNVRRTRRTAARTAERATGSSEAGGNA